MEYLDSDSSVDCDPSCIKYLDRSYLGSAGHNWHEWDYVEDCLNGIPGGPFEDVSDISEPESI